MAKKSKNLGLKIGNSVLKYKYTLVKASVSTDLKDKLQNKCSKLRMSESEYVRVIVENSLKDWK